MVGKLRRQMPMGVIVLGSDHDAARFLVETMHNARPLDAADAGKARAAMMDQRVDERSRPVAGPRMNDKPGGLRDHDQIVVLVKNLQRNILALRLRIFRVGMSMTTSSPAGSSSSAL